MSAERTWGVLTRALLFSFTMRNNEDIINEVSQEPRYDEEIPVDEGRVYLMGENRDHFDH